MADSSRRELLKLALTSSLATALPGNGLRAQLTGKLVTVVFPFGPGGAVDAVARAVAAHLAADLGTTVIVDNKPGAASMIGAGFVANAPKDGNTLLWASWSTLVTNFFLYKDLKFSLDSFAPITTTLKGYVGVAVPEANPAKDFAQLLEQVRRTTGKLEFGCLGSGTSPHLLMELAQSKVQGVRLSNVGYRTEHQGVLDVLGGHLPMFVGSLSNMEQHQGKGLKIIAISTRERSAKMPDVPTFHECGFPELDFLYWHGVCAPAGTPQGAIDAVGASVRKSMFLPDVRAKLSVDQEPLATSPDQFCKLIDDDRHKWGSIIREREIAIN